MAHRYNEGLIKGVCEALNVGSLREIAIEKKFRGSGERYVCFFLMWISVGFSKRRRKNIPDTQKQIKYVHFPVKLS